jgi:hypothetical protein
MTTVPVCRTNPPLQVLPISHAAGERGLTQSAEFAILARLRRFDRLVSTSACGRMGIPRTNTAKASLKISPEFSPIAIRLRAFLFFAELFAPSARFRPLAKA